MELERKSNVLKGLTAMLNFVKNLRAKLYGNMTNRAEAVDKSLLKLLQRFENY